MRALILNSGLGTRLEELTADKCKCLVEIEDGVTILDMQIRSLFACGIRDICVTTGAFADKLENYLAEKYPQGQFTFVNNPVYDKTNYIYSIYLAKEYLYQDILLIHGDLVFDISVLQDLIEAESSVLVIDSTKQLPEKDFKATVDGGRISKVGVNIFSEAFYTQPMYKLLKKDWFIWLEEINRFCGDNRTGVYAEDALNCVSRNMDLRPLDILGRDCFEVDNKVDLLKAKEFYKKSPQMVLVGDGSRKHITDILYTENVNKPMVVCALRSNGIVPYDNAVYFNEFTSNPKHDEVLAGIEIFKRENCDFLISLDGGSAIDVAKCINILTLDDKPALREIPRCKHLSVPTTAGTGSEATHFAVLYKDGEKLSIAHKYILPEYAILDPDFLKTLPIYHKKSAMLDALCQSIESLWAKGATFESREYASESIRLIEENEQSYLSGYDKESALNMLKAAHLSGKAINISKTTAAHAMSYGLTEEFGIAHGHAVALCLPLVWEHLARHGKVPELLTRNKYNELTARLTELDMVYDISCGKKADDIAAKLAASVNTERLSNHPVPLSEKEIIDMYLTILNF